LTLRKKFDKITVMGKKCRILCIFLVTDCVVIPPKLGCSWFRDLSDVSQDDSSSDRFSRKHYIKLEGVVVGGGVSEKRFWLRRKSFFLRLYERAS
jgi:hypothetical protein